MKTIFNLPSIIRGKKGYFKTPSFPIKYIELNLKDRYKGNINYRDLKFNTGKSLIFEKRLYNILSLMGY